MAFGTAKTQHAPDMPCGCVRADKDRAIHDLRAMAARVLLATKNENPGLRDFALEVLQRIAGL